MFIDAIVMIRDPTLLIKEEMKHKLLVTLSDFGGEKDQSLLNTGLLAAAPGKQTWDLLEDWIRTELYGQADEQEHLVYEIAPRAKEEGKKIHGMPHQMFPSYLTFYKGRLENIRTKHGDYAKYGTPRSFMPGTAARWLVRRRFSIGSTRWTGSRCFPGTLAAGTATGTTST